MTKIWAVENLRPKKKLRRPIAIMTWNEFIDGIAVEVSFECCVGIRILHVGKNRVCVWQRLMYVVALVCDYKK